jgi:hypothetical protein
MTVNQNVLYIRFLVNLTVCLHSAQTNKLLGLSAQANYTD